MKALDVAKYIINKSIDFGKPISNLQLQKIMYFVHLDFLRKTGKKLITDEKFQAWQWGPVIRGVYSEYRFFGGNKITVPEEGDSLDLIEKEKDIINATIQTSIDSKPWELVQKSHIKGGAWDRIYKDGEGDKLIIPDDLIQEEANAKLQ